MTTLTNEQESRRKALFDEGIKLGTNTKQASFDDIKEHVYKMYEYADLPKKPLVLIFDSPLACNRAIQVLRNPSTPNTRDEKEIQEYVNNELKSSGSSKVKVNTPCFIMQAELYWIQFYRFFLSEPHYKPDPLAIEKLLFMKECCSRINFIYTFTNVCILSRMPVHVKMNANEVPLAHCETDYAVKYPDGTGVASINGLRVPDFFVKDKSKITTKYIQNEQNAEIRQIATKLYGYERFFNDIGAKVIHEETIGIYPYKLLEIDDKIMGKMRAITMKDRTPTLQGDFKRYFIRVDPKCNTVKEALASTLRVHYKGELVQILDADDYAFDAES